MGEGISFMFSLNVISHVILLWFALTVLFWVIIAPKEKKVLTNEFTSNINDNLPAAFDNANQQSKGVLKTAMKPTLPAFELMGEQYDKPDKATDTYNKMLLAVALLVGGLFLTILITALVVGKTIAHYPDLGKRYTWIVVEQLVLLAFIGVVEGVFFFLVASKYVPTKPSLIVTQVITDLKGSFDSTVTPLI